MTAASIGQRKLIFHILLLLLIPLCFLGPLFKKGLYQSHDGEAHVARFGAYVKAFKDGQLPPRWAGDLNYRYGTPLFIFYYPLPGWIASGLHALGFSLVDSFKILIGSVFVLAPLPFFLWSSRFLQKKAALVASLLYGFAPYHFLDLYVRGDVGELLSFVFIPLVFFAIDRYIEKKSLVHFLIGGSSYSLLILSHNVISLIFSPIFLAYILLKKERLEKKQGSMMILLTGLLLSAFFWIPALLETRYTNSKLFIGDMYKDNFLSVSQLVFPSWGFGPDVTKPGGLSPHIGVLHGILSVVSLITFFTHRKLRNKLYGFWIGIFFISIIMTLPVSQFVWELLPLINVFQFPWRFVALTSFASACLAGYALGSLNQKRIFYLSLVLLLILSSFYVRVKGYDYQANSYYESYQGTTDYHSAATTMWTAGNPGTPPKATVEVIGGAAKVEHMMRKSNLHSFVIDAASESKILDNTIYFPGWRVLVGKQKTPIEFQDPQHRGLITFTVPKGKHKISVVFGESPIRFLSHMVSIVTLFGGIGIMLIKKIASRRAV